MKWRDYMIKDKWSYFSEKKKIADLESDERMAKNMGITLEQYYIRLESENGLFGISLLNARHAIKSIPSFEGDLRSDDDFGL